MRLKRKNLFLLLIIFFAFIGQVWFQNTETFPENKFFALQSDFPILKSSLFSLVQYMDHEPISIDGNDDFSNQAATEGWSGDGTESTPYLIDSYNITGSIDLAKHYWKPLIEISNTDVYFQISNCLLNGSTGIMLEDSINGYISKNIITNNSNCGISISKGGFFTISSNYIVNNGYKNQYRGGIYLYDVGKLIIFNNNVSKNEGNGIGGSYITGSNISDNTITKNKENGIFIWETSNNIISSNTINSNEEDGIDIGGSNDVISSNTISYNKKYGVDLGSGGYVGGTKVNWNVFIKNNIVGVSQAYDGSNNRNIFSYNYWDDWTSPDADSDGIVDNPYSIYGSSVEDSHPLVIPTTEPFTTTTTPTTSTESLTSESTKTSESTPGFASITWLIFITIVFLKRKPRHNQ